MPPNPSPLNAVFCRNEPLLSSSACLTSDMQYSLIISTSNSSVVSSSTRISMSAQSMMNASHTRGLNQCRQSTK